MTFIPTALVLFQSYFYHDIASYILQHKYKKQKAHNKHKI